MTRKIHFPYHEDVGDEMRRFWKMVGLTESGLAEVFTVHATPEELRMFLREGERSVMRDVNEMVDEVVDGVEGQT
jgi:thiamine phosphate synthase YjbQ (UPF0047 family)